MRVSVSGGTPVPVTTVDRAQHTCIAGRFSCPTASTCSTSPFMNLPSPQIMRSTPRWMDARIVRCSTVESNAVYAGGFLLFARGDQLMAQPFNPASGTLSGEPVSIAKGVMNDVTTWHMDASAFGDGLLLVGNGGSGDWQLVWVDRSGKQISIAADKLTNLQTAAISPHGDRIVLQLDTGQATSGCLMWRAESAPG